MKFVVNEHLNPFNALAAKQYTGLVRGAKLHTKKDPTEGSAAIVELQLLGTGLEHITKDVWFDIESPESEVRTMAARNLAELLKAAGVEVIENLETDLHTALADKTLNFEIKKSKRGNNYICNYAPATTVNNTTATAADFNSASY